MQNSQDPKIPKKGKQETINELAHRHLKDKGHITSDEEIRNATVEEGANEEVADKSLYEIDNSTVLDEAPGKNDDRKELPNAYEVVE